VITWLHGAFGVGRSSVAAELARRRPDLVPYDPELVGHVLLDVAEDELRRRIVDDAAETGAREWRLDRVAAYARARSSLVPLADLVVDTTALPVAQVADRVLTAVGEHPASGRGGVP